MSNRNDQAQDPNHHLSPTPEQTPDRQPQHHQHNAPPLTQEPTATLAPATASVVSNAFGVNLLHPGGPHDAPNHHLNYQNPANTQRVPDRDIHDAVNSENQPQLVQQDGQDNALRGIDIPTTPLNRILTPPPAPRNVTLPKPQPDPVDEMPPLVLPPSIPYFHHEH